MSEKSYTAEQQKFLDVLFEEAKGDPTKAKRLAGYSENTATSRVTAALQDEIVELTRKYIAQSSTSAAWELVNIITTNDLVLGAKEKMSAAKDILDRAGLVKTEKVEVTAAEPVFILPSKNAQED